MLTCSDTYREILQCLKVKLYVKIKFCRQRKVLNDFVYMPFMLQYGRHFSLRRQTGCPTRSHFRGRCECQSVAKQVENTSQVLKREKIILPTIPAVAAFTKRFLAFLPESSLLWGKNQRGADQQIPCELGNWGAKIFWNQFLYRQVQTLKGLLPPFQCTTLYTWTKSLMKLC